MQTIKKQRNSNLELYRIICMFMIVAHHSVVNSGVMEEMSKSMMSPNSIYLYLLGMWGKIGINCFVLITGYFMCTSHITLQKFLKLTLQILFYSVVINAIFYFTGRVTFTAKEFISIFWPVHGINQNFGSCFLVFFLAIPFLNILVQNMTKKAHQLLLVLVIVSHTILAVPFFMYTVTINYVEWFAILYLISSYLRLYPTKYDCSTRFWLLSTIAAVSVSMLSVIYQLSKNAPNPYNYVADSNQLLALAVGVCSFMLFKNLHIPQSKIINSIAATTFGILLIHANSDTMREWLWKDTINCIGHYSLPLTNLILYSLSAVAVIFAICSFIDFLRIRIIERPFFTWLSPKLEKYDR